MPTNLVFVNQKGGVGKTTSTHNTAAILAEKYKVLAVDLDPQGNLSLGCNVLDSEHTIFDLLKGTIDIKDCIVKTDNFDLLPANISLAGIERELSDSIGGEYRLKEALDQVDTKYDYCLIDCPPTLGKLTALGLVAADWCVIPTTASSWATKGIIQLGDIIEATRKYVNKDLNIAGILITKYNPRTVNTKTMETLLTRIANSVDTDVFKTRIRSAVAVEEGQSINQPIVKYKNSSNPAKDYRLFVDELLNKINSKEK